ncbi:hypothetical protein IJJ27_00370 [bacterium]|nr:hypothetical protein [bacterium]
MKKTLTNLLISSLVAAGWLASLHSAAAQMVVPLTVPTETREASESASNSAAIVNPEVKQLIQEKKDQDVTETTGGKTDELASHLLEQADKPLSWNNFLQYWIRRAVNQGLPSNLIVLLMLFPLVSSIIALSRHIIGLKGFGIYTPAVLSVALVSTGIPIGITMFVIIVFVSVLLHRLLKRTNIAHLPKTAIILWGVCLSVIILLITTACAGLKVFYSLSIFPLLILISLSENFTSTQLISSTKEAIRLTVETMVLATVAALIIGNNSVQQFVIVNPELTIIVTLIIDILIGRYNGLRFMELFRFKALIKKD